MQSQKPKKQRTTCNQEVFIDVARELGLTTAVIKEIFNSHSMFTRKTIESNSFNGVRWPYLGAFKSKPKEVQVLNHLKGLTPEQAKIFKEEVKAGKYRKKRDEPTSRY